MASGVLKMRKCSFFVSEQIVVFNLVKQTCMKLLNKMQHIALPTVAFKGECSSLQINNSP